MIASLYPMIGGEHCEVKAETSITSPSGPFDSPAVIAGRLLLRPTPDEFREIVANEVLYEGEVYTFACLRGDGSFELRKSGETAHVSFLVER
jgi:hypothetical protein